VSNIRAILWGLIQAIVVIFVCSMTVIIIYQLQISETCTDGFLDDIAFLLLFGVAALISGTVVLARPVYLMLQQQISAGFVLLLSTIVWLALILICAIVAIVFFDVRVIF
jgi:hypothetical protein